MIGKGSKILVIGAGAIGGVTAACMKRAGHDVEIVCKYPDLAHRINTSGLHVFGKKGDFRAPMPAAARVGDIGGKKDVVFLATKAVDMRKPARELLPLLGPDSVVVSLQNGLCEDALGEILGRDRTMGCVVGWGATMHEPGELEMTSTGEFVIGNIDGKTDPRLAPIREMLETVVPVSISGNIMGSLYSKLIVNACITSLGAVSGLFVGEMLKIRKIRNIFIEIMYEAMAVAKAMGLCVEVFSGKLDYYKFLDGRGPLSDFKRHLFIRIIGFKYRRLKSSSLQSLERGKPTEIDYLNGYIAQKGAEHQTPTPVNDKIIQLIKEIEAGRRQITPVNFDDLFFSKFGPGSNLGTR
ncbi:MAG: 2-dehydropantoate 2-reductase [Desulfobacterales bacterium]|nr:2-dehydropantoate 2-reductase [Desulfobacterales bacterium]